MVGQQLSQTNEKCYSVRCNSFYHYFTDLNTARVNWGWQDTCSMSDRRLSLSCCPAMKGQLQCCIFEGAIVHWNGNHAKHEWVAAVISPCATVNGEFVKRGRDFDADYFTVDEDTRQCLHEEDRTSQVNFTKAMRTFCAFLAAGRQAGKKMCSLSLPSFNSQLYKIHDSNSIKICFGRAPMLFPSFEFRHFLDPKTQNTKFM